MATLSIPADPRQKELAQRILSLQPDVHARNRPRGYTGSCFGTSTSVGRSAQEYAPRRSVSSMTTLLPLLLSSSAQPTMSGSMPGSSVPDCSTSQKMDIGDSMAESNLPELLVKDLEASGDIFTLKAMTAGCPSAGLASSDLVDISSLQGLALFHPSDSQLQHPVNCHGLSSPITSGVHFYIQSRDYARQNGIGSSDSFSDISVGAEPPSIRTRGQSISTAATSITGRSSSLSSRKSPSPSPSLPLPSFSERGDSPHQTWYKTGDLPGEPERSAAPDRSSDSVQHQTAPKDDDSNTIASLPESPDDLLGVPTTAVVRLPVRRPSRVSRPHTGQVLLEKPRVVNISPVMVAPKLVSSSTSSCYGVEPATTASKSCESISLEASKTIGRPAGYDSTSRMASAPGMPLLATPKGRTVIDASMGLTSRDQPLHCPHAPSKPPPNRIDESEISSDEETPRTGSKAGPTVPKRNQSLAKLRPRIGGGAEALSSRPNFTPHPHSVSAHGIPLPPDVVETLRVSISCFPETMLLSSSLSIDTIRTYSKKIKHRTDLDRQQENQDNHPGFPSSSPNNMKLTKRWNVAWLGHLQQQDQYHPVHMPTISFASPVPMKPIWAPIKNVFPAASDYLCDALYAHLVAYNYISSLCPPPVIRRPTTAASSRNRRSNSPDNSARNLKIPEKAASLLGMRDPVTSTPSRHGYHHQQNYHDRPQARRLFSRRLSHGFEDIFPRSRSAGLGNAEAPAMREIQTGLGRCIGLLIETMKSSTAMWNGAEQELRLLMRDREMEGEGQAEGGDPVLMRALCEAVRCAEERD
ncbi:hypothetical protein VTK56DRAFT_9494 [Thermocarpiscus australiensis]